MVVRFKKKSRKMRGRKRHGHGEKKKHRKSGSRGGKGNAGLMKHKKIHMVKYDPQHFGRRGFKPILKKDVKTLNLIGLMKIAEKTGEKEIDISKYGYDKLLGNGKILVPLVVKAKNVSKKAIEKIESVGGKVISD